MSNVFWYSFMGENHSMNILLDKNDCPLAQLAERHTLNVNVLGSNPRGTTKMYHAVAMAPGVH